MIVHLEDEPWDSGLAHYALTLAVEQARRGERVEFWTRPKSPLTEAAARLGLTVREWAGAGGWARLPALRRAARAAVVLNAHTGSSHLLALAAALGSKAAVVRTRGDARSPRGGVLARAAAARTAAFIAANTRLSSALAAAFPGARVCFVPQGVPGPAAAPALPDAPVVGMLARFDPVKGHATLGAAVAGLKKEFPALRAVCAGEGRLLAEVRAAGTLECPGFVVDKDAFLASCRIGVVASLGSEAVSRAALEWMAAGRPVIASAVGGLADLVSDGVTGLLVPPADASALASALRRLLSDPAEAARLGAAGRRRWSERFSPAPFYDATKRVYDDATNHPPR